MTDIKLYGVKDVMELLQISERTALKYLNEKKLVGRKIGRKWVVSEENLKNFINGQEEK